MSRISRNATNLGTKAATLLQGSSTPRLQATPANIAAVLAFSDDAFLADLGLDRHVLGHRLGLEADALLGHHPLFDNRFLGMQHHFVVARPPLRAAERLVPVGLGDRFADDP